MRDADPGIIIGLPEMDAQHAYLYRLFALLEDGSRVADPDRTKRLLVEIERYLHFHFTSEEHLMRCYLYPEFGAHQTDHEAAGGRFLRFLDDFDAGILNPAAAKLFLHGWLSEHGRTADTAYVSWIERRRSEAGVTPG